MVQPGDLIRIESRKHGGRFHRSWARSVVLDVKGPLLAANRSVQVTEADGCQWLTKGLAICQFHRSEWFNTIILFTPGGFYRFYCNIASPYILRKNDLIYVDYDLDLLVEADGSCRWLDREEFERNRRFYSYPPHVITQVNDAAKRLEDRATSGKPPFTPAFAQYGYHLYQSYEHQLMG